MVAIIDQNAILVERVSYDAYGNARHHRLGDLTGDGATTTDDRNLLLGNSREYGVGDLDRDGEVTSNDLALLDADMGAALPAGWLSSSGGTDNIVGYAGYIFNAELVSAGSAGLYTVRHRHYAPDLGRWLSRDPLGYVDGMSLYEYVRGRVTTWLDQTGLFGVQPGMPPEIGPGLPGHSAASACCRHHFDRGTDEYKACFDGSMRVNPVNPDSAPGVSCAEACVGLSAAERYACMAGCHAFQTGDCQSPRSMRCGEDRATCKSRCDGCLTRCILLPGPGSGVQNVDDIFKLPR